MNMPEHNLNVINITILFSHLNRDYVSRDKIRVLISEKPIITDLPDLLLFHYPQNGATIIFENQRIIINSQAKEGLSKISSLLASLAKGACEAVEEGNIIAYGFNFDGTVKVGTAFVPIAKYFKEKFFIPQPSLESTFEGTMEGVSPKFTLRRQEFDFNIALEPMADKNDLFSYHLNVNFATSTIPSIEELSDDINIKFVLFMRLLETL